MYASDRMNVINKHNNVWPSVVIVMFLFFSLVVHDCSVNHSDDRTVNANPYEYHYGDASLQEGYDLIMTSDGNYVIVGTTKQSPDSNSRFRGYILKLDHNARVAWDLNIAFGKICHGVVETDDSQYVIMSTYFTGDQLELQKRSVDGNLIWLRLFQSVSMGDISFHSFKQTHDGGYIISGGANNATQHA